MSRIRRGAVATAVALGLAGGVLTATSASAAEQPGALVPAGWTVKVDTGYPNKTVFGNLTVTNPQGDGFLTVYPCDQPLPVASNINYVTGQTVANAAAVKTDAQGAICVYSSNKAHFIWDHVAQEPTQAVTTTAPKRIVDTRTSPHEEFNTATDTARPTKVGARRTLLLHTGQPGKAVLGNLTVTNPVGGGFVTLHPCQADRPWASNVNYAPGQTIAGFAVVQADSKGDICAYVSNTTDLIWDQVGATAVTTSVKRLVDTRVDSWQDGQRNTQTAGAKVPAGGVLRIHSTNTARAPVVGTLTVTEPAGAGYITMYPCDQPRPLASNVNYVANINIANLVTVGSDGSGDICAFTTSAAHLIWDRTAEPGNVFVQGSVTTPTRQLDTRQTWKSSTPGFLTTKTLVGVGQRFPGTSRPVEFAGDGGPATDAVISRPTTVVADPKGGYYFTDSMNNRIRRVDANGTITTVVGSGNPNPNISCAYDVPALQACLWVPHGITLDDDGSLIIADTFNNIISRVGPDGMVRRIAGSGRYCERAKTTCGEGGAWQNADLKWPTVARRTPQGLVVSDTANRVLLVHDGVTSRIAGTGSPGLSGDMGPATSAKMWAPADVVPYRGGWLISDGNNCRLRWVDPSGIIHPFAGYGGDLQTCWNSYATVTLGSWGGALTGDIGDGRSAYASRMSVTGFIALKGDDIYLTDFLNSRVRKIDANGIITTVVGTGENPESNTDGPVPGPAYSLGWVSGVAYDAAQNRLLISDAGSQRVLEARLAQ